MTLGFSGLRPTLGFFVSGNFVYFVHNLGRFWNVEEVGFASLLVVVFVVVVGCRTLCVAIYAYGRIVI